MILPSCASDRTVGIMTVKGAEKALEAGAFALVVGGAITRPAEITARFTGAINAMNK